MSFELPLNFKVRVLLQSQLERETDALASCLFRQHLAHIAPLRAVPDQGAYSGVAASSRGP
jgi:hypothetical protein